MYWNSRTSSGDHVHIKQHSPTIKICFKKVSFTLGCLQTQISVLHILPWITRINKLTLIFPGLYAINYLAALNKNILMMNDHHDSD